ncbi:MAG: NTPase [Neisseria lactamica]|nr:NTPase [Neisseria lactamica]
METQALEKTFATHDEFNRKPIAENIIKLLTSPIDLSPMVIDGGWGTGKTEFCKKLIRLMQEQHRDYQPVYIDAFRSDHSGEPLLALLAEIIKACTPEDTDGQPSEKRKSFTNRISKVAGFGIKTIFKAVMGHVLKQNTDDLAEELQQIMNDDQEARSVAETVTDTANTIANHTIDVVVEALLKEQIEAEKNLETLKACLKELAADKPIILFIDELDRCRPDYAVDMLEVIKHVFDIENVKVVLVTNTKQLRAAINHRYGAEVDAQKYLDKFLKYNFALPDKVVAQTEQDRVWVSIYHFERLIKDSGIEGGSGYGVMECINEMIRRNNLSLRETERLVRFLEIYHSFSNGLVENSGSIFFPNPDRVRVWLRVIGVFIFCFYPSLMDDINKNQTDAKKFAQLFSLQALPNIPKDINDLKYVDIIAVMLIRYSKIKDSHFVSDENDYWETQIKNIVFDNISFRSSPIDGVLSVLKETFRVLSLEQAAQ